MPIPPGIGLPQQENEIMQWKTSTNTKQELKFAPVTAQPCLTVPKNTKSANRILQVPITFPQKPKVGHLNSCLSGSFIPEKIACCNLLVVF